MPTWLSVLFITLALILVAGQYWRSGRKDFLRYGLIWLAIIAVVALLYNALESRFNHSAPAPLPETKSEGTNL